MPRCLEKCCFEVDKDMWQCTTTSSRYKRFGRQRESDEFDVDSKSKLQLMSQMLSNFHGNKIWMRKCRFENSEGLAASRRQSGFVWPSKYRGWWAYKLFGGTAVIIKTKHIHWITAYQQRKNSNSPKTLTILNVSARGEGVIFPNYFPPSCYAPAASTSSGQLRDLENCQVSQHQKNLFNANLDDDSMREYPTITIKNREDCSRSTRIWSHHNENVWPQRHRRFAPSDDFSIEIVQKLVSSGFWIPKLNYSHTNNPKRRLLWDREAPLVSALSIPRENALHRRHHIVSYATFEAKHIFTMHSETLVSILRCSWDHHIKNQVVLAVTKLNILRSAFHKNIWISISEC